MIEDAAVFSVLSKCFGPVDEAEWKHLSDSAVWSEFLDGARRLMQDDGTLGRDLSPMQRMRISRDRCPLQDFLSAGEVDALYCPPTFAEKRSFAARHFTGGLPDSALPVESLYTAWDRPGTPDSLFAGATNMYLGRSARYMQALCESMNLTVPDDFAACPDHLALELDVCAVLLRSNMVDEARTFLSERFDWLTAYRMRLIELSDDARFYIGLVDVLLGIVATQTADLEEE